MVNEHAPRVWAGAEFRGDPGDQLSVLSLNAWFRREIGVTHPPKTKVGWSHTRQTHLYMLQHATVFHDPLGEFTARRDGFRFYPHEVWLSQVRAQLLWVWHYGQYNFARRMVHRQDSATTSICLNEFVQATMRLCMLLNGDYAPYWKWLPTEFRKQPNTVHLNVMLDNLLRASETTEQVLLVDGISRDIYHRLDEKGLIANILVDDPNSLSKIHDMLEAQGY